MSGVKKSLQAQQLNVGMEPRGGRGICLGRVELCCTAGDPNLSRFGRENEGGEEDYELGVNGGRMH